MKLYIKKHSGALVAVDQAGQDAIDELKHGQWYRADIIKPRNIKFHSKFFALLGNVVEMSDFFTGKPKGLAVEELLERIKYKAGFYTITAEIEVEGHKVQMIKTKSIAFNKMDNLQFEEFYGLAVGIILSDEDLNIDANSLNF